MCHKLKQSEIDEISTWSDEKLLDQVEYFGDYKTLIETQNANGISNKDDNDKDVVKMKSDYNAVRAELLTRLKNQQKIDLLATIEEGSNQIALISAGDSKVLGIPAHGNSLSQVASIKTQYKSDREELETALGI